jgi:hypothetical protein
MPLFTGINSMGKLLSNKKGEFYDFRLNSLLLSCFHRILIFASLILLSLWSSAQFPAFDSIQTNLRQKFFPVSADSIIVDTVSVIPSSFSVSGVPEKDYRLDFVKAVLYWLKKPDADSVQITYRVFPFTLNPVAQRISFDSIMQKLYVAPFEFQTGAKGRQEGIFNFGTLRAEGSLGRQIAFGNNQDAVVNSTLNLQLSGMLGDSIEIQAAITDNNIPIQPDGTTQQLNEFDQVYLQFKKKGWQLNIGDIDIRQSQDYFLNFYKRLQGVAFSTTNRISENTISRTLLSGSIAKGKFNRQFITALEGNQGPYRLRGPNNEFFFIVLANTERVFIDGELLQRGEDQDYVINYNTAEITFTPKRMITKDSRIQVEFEYSDRNYLNANFYISEELEINRKLKLRAGFFNNSDAKNSQIQQELDAGQKLFLANLGDSIHKALYPAVALDTFAAGKILYEKIYYNPGSGIDSFYQYSTDPAVARYSLGFTDVGQGNGNYIPDFTGANGKVYKFVMPVSGVKQGRFEPALFLVTPKKQQIINLAVEYAINENTLLKTEAATSNYDVNTFSVIDNGDDRGWAAKIQLSHRKPLPSKSNWVLQTALDYEFVQDKFRPLERLRAVEFSRDWGLPFNPNAATENIIKATAGIRNRSNHSLQYSFINYHRSDDYNGNRQSLIHSGSLQGWQFNNQFVITTYRSFLTKGNFLRPVADISKQFRQLNNWRLGFRYALEHNPDRIRTPDTLAAGAFSFDTWSVYLKSDEKKMNRYGISFFTRSDKYPAGKDFIRGDRSYNLNLQAALLANAKRQFYLNTTFRKLHVYNAAVSKQTEDETILGRVEYVMSEWKGLLTGNIFYEVGAGQEQRRDFAYLEVPAGTGQYAWIDYNNDGVQQLNEFELAAFPDQAKFIRIFTPTNEFLKANYITFNYNFSINPRSLMTAPGLKGFKKIISRFNLVTSLQINKKSVSEGTFEFNPFKYGVQDTALVTLNTIFLNTIAFNRFSSKWSVDLSNIRNNGQSLLTYGYESRKLNDWILKGRLNVSRAISLNLNAKKGMNALYTPLFGNRNYQLRVYSVEPGITFISGTVFRVITTYKYDNKKNLPAYGAEQSVSNSLNVETKYNILQKSSLTGKFTFNNIDFKFPVNTTVSYIMLDGLLPGSNYLWAISFTRRLLNNVEISFQYDGRKPGNARTVHVGRAAMTALF